MALPLLLKLTRLLSPAVDATRPRLISIGFSHFSEKARWALDLSPWAQEYYEEMHFPALHLSSTLETKLMERVVTWNLDSNFHKLLKLRYNSDKVSHGKEITSVPKLILPKSYTQNSECFEILPRKVTTLHRGSYVVARGSSGILKTLSDVFPMEMGHLYPASHFEQVIELEHLLDTQFAPAVTDWDFANMLLTGTAFSPTPSTAAAEHSSPSDNSDSVKFLISFFSTQPVPLVEKALFKLLFTRMLRPLMVKANNVHADNVAPAQAEIHKIFTLMDSLLAKNNPTGDVNNHFLLGTERITAADIAFASFASAVLLPMQMGRFFPSCESLTEPYSHSSSPRSAGMRNLFLFATELREKYRSARYVCDLYETQRFAAQPPRYTFYGAYDGEGGVRSRAREVVPRVR